MTAFEVLAWAVLGSAAAVVLFLTINFVVKVFRAETARINQILTGFTPEHPRVDE